MNSNTPDQTDITLIEGADFFSGSDDTMEFIGRTVAYDEAGKLAPKSITIGNNTKPKPRGKVLAHDKLNTARKLYAKKRDGDAFIDDNHVLFAANEIAKELASVNLEVYGTSTISGYTRTELEPHEANWPEPEPDEPRPRTETGEPSRTRRTNRVNRTARTA